MKPTSAIINTSRGGVIDETALTEALTSKSIAAAGLHVTEHELPAPTVTPLPLTPLHIPPHPPRHRPGQAAIPRLLGGPHARTMPMAVLA